MQKCKEIIHVHQNCGKHHSLTNSEMAPYFFIFANRKKTEPREVTKQVVWIILRNRIFHGTIRHIRSGFPSYARTLCALTLLAYALKGILNRKILLLRTIFVLNIYWGILSYCFITILITLLTRWMVGNSENMVSCGEALFNLFYQRSLIGLKVILQRKERKTDLAYLLTI